MTVNKYRCNDIIIMREVHFEKFYFGELHFANLNNKINNKFITIYY